MILSNMRINKSKNSFFAQFTTLSRLSLVESYPVTEILEAVGGVVDELLLDVGTQPAAAVLNDLGQVPVVESDLQGEGRQSNKSTSS